MQKVFAKLMALPKWILTVGVIIVLAGGWLIYKNIAAAAANKPTYTTAQATKGTIVVSVSGSGSVTGTNNVTVSTQATGVVSKVYVKDGDSVKSGQKLADLTLDMVGKQAADAAYASYMAAKNSLASSQTALYSTQSTMLGKWNTYYNLATNNYYTDSSGTPQHRTEEPIVAAQDDWLAAEAQYKQQQDVIAQAQVAMSSSWLSYQQHAASIYAPITGTISGFSLQNGTVVNATTSSSGTNIATKIASVVTNAKPTIMVTLSEIDIPKVKVGDKVTVTIDSQPDKTFTGKVVSTDTVGSVSSGVTSYPVYISLDTDEASLYPNMSASANIITETKDNVLMVPSSAVSNQNGTSTVQVMKNGQPQAVTVTTGISSDTETEITSGLNVGDTVVTATIQPANNTSTQTNSVFSSFGRGGGGGTRVIQGR